MIRSEIIRSIIIGFYNIMKMVGSIVTRTCMAVCNHGKENKGKMQNSCFYLVSRRISDVEIGRAILCWPKSRSLVLGKEGKYKNKNKNKKGLVLRDVFGGHRAT